MLPSSRLVHGAIALARWFPAPVFRGFAWAVGSLGWCFDRNRYAIVRENVRHLAPQATGREQRRLSRRLFRNLFLAASDLFRVPSLSRSEILDLVEIEGREHLETARSLGRGALVVTPHLGPYELGAIVVAALGYRAHAVVEDIDVETNAALAAYRSATGLRLVSRNTGVRQVYRLLADGDFVLLVADRVVGQTTEGLAVPFGDGWRRIPEGPGALASATGAPVIVGSVVRTSGSGRRYRMVFEAPIWPSGLDREALTRRVATRFDAMVRAHPDEWYVFQPQWLTSAGPA